MTGKNSARLHVVGAGDRRFAEIYESYFRHIYAYCRRRTNADRVDDAVADVFLVAWRRIDDVPYEDETLPWLYGVAYKTLGQQWRGASRQKKLDRKLTAVGVDSKSGTEELIVQSSEANLVRQALLNLKPQEQEVLRLSIWEDLSHNEVASILEISVDATKQRVSRARKSLTREYNRLERRRPNPPAAQKGGAM